MVGTFTKIYTAVGELIGLYFPIVINDKGYIDIQYLCACVLLCMAVWWTFKCIHTFLKGVVLGG